MGININNQVSSHLTDIFDFTDPVKRIYLAIMKSGAISLEDFLKTNEVEMDKEEIKIYLDILVRQQYLEKYKEHNLIKYRVKGLNRKSRKIPKSIWKKLE